jgi:Ca2+/Na+ antiporter
VRNNILSLIGGTLALGSAGVIVSPYLCPDLPIPLYSLVAAALCLGPTVVTMIWAARTGSRNPENALLMVFGGTALRMTLILAVSLLLFYTVPVFGRMSFWIVILVFYLFTLGLEIALLVSGPMNAAKGKEM